MILILELFIVVFGLIGDFLDFRFNIWLEENVG